ncbi:MAG: CsgG/HfaB family protein [candidate division KSB1 bacterium]|nr:CsgG/HfaB family protein [candidate division KSB1 bacterium]MDZ7300545.1 CsgG/HfaB family protein [candidate division KSB1 bacterium]MDZ7309684.1 CsgG/HfaB family protein [candidate division KSB1 bacterium]
MKRISVSLFLIFTLLVFGFNAASAQEKAKSTKKRVAVFNFEDKTDHAWHWWTGQPVGHGMADMLITALVKSGRYRVMERQEMEKLLQEQGLGMAGIVTPESAAKAGKMLGVELAIVGAVTEFGYKKQSTGGALKKIGIGATVSKQAASVGIDVRFVNTTSGEILKAENVRKEKSKIGGSLDTQDINFDSQAQFDESLVGKATREAIEEIIKLLDEQSGIETVWEAKVVMMKEDQVIINKGAEDGVKVGERFVIYRAGEEMIDPDTGESLGSEETKVGTLEVVNNNFGGKGKASACKIVSGSDFQKGDMVRQK